MDGRVRKAVALMRENLHRELPLNEIAQAVNLSSWRLSHLFKAETGTSPTHYLKWLRMQRAKELLETTFLSVKEIRDKVGARDESHFVRNFKGFYGLSPMQYRISFLGARLEGGNARNPSGASPNGEANGGNGHTVSSSDINNAGRNSPPVDGSIRAARDAQLETPPEVGRMSWKRNRKTPKL